MIIQFNKPLPSQCQAVYVVRGAGLTLIRGRLWDGREGMLTHCLFSFPPQQWEKPS